MNRLTRRKSIAPRFVMLLLALFCSGCLRADVFEFFTYDSSTDTFGFLQLDLNITNDEQSDLDHLAELWKERDQVIVQPSILRIWNLPAMLRVDASHVQMIDFAKKASEPPATVAIDIPLDSIQIEPGKFFYTPDRTLCYYQQVTCPGKVIDQALTVASQPLATGIKGSVDLEIKRRADGAKAGTWDDFRKQLKPPGPAAPAGGGQQQQSASPLDDVSLARISKAAGAGELAIHRQGAEFSLALPLSAADCQEAQKTMAVWQQHVADAMKKAPGDYSLGLSAAFTGEIGNGDQFVIKVDVVKFTKLNEVSYPLKTAPGSAKLPDNPTKPLETHFSERSIATLQKNSISIDEKLTAKEVVEKFLAGR